MTGMDKYGICIISHTIVGKPNTVDISYIVCTLEYV